MTIKEQEPRRQWLTLHLNTWLLHLGSYQEGKQTSESTKTMDTIVNQLI